MSGPPLRVFITGASSGIGHALAREYSRRGATLGLLARRVDLLDQFAATLPAPAYAYAADVRDAAAVDRAAQNFVSRAGGADVVIANAGVSSGTLTERSEDHRVSEEILDINVLGMMHTFAPFVAGMRERASGVLVGIASVAGVRGLPGAAAYCASKAAAISYLESLRVELRATGIAVTTIAPGYIDTPMTQGNPYPMPFLMDAERAAARMADIIERRKRFAVVPWQMAAVAALLRALPNPLYDRLLSRAPRKARRD